MWENKLKKTFSLIKHKFNSCDNLTPFYEISFFHSMKNTVKISFKLYLSHFCCRPVV